MKSWKKKAIFLTAFTSIAIPIGIVFSDSGSKKVTPTKEVAIEKPSKLFDAENEFDATKFYELKNKLGELKEV